HFIWTAPMPLTIFSNLNYELVLVEVEAGQSKGDAIQRNLPVWSLGNIRTNTALYPSSWISLDTGKVYAWQVTARNGDYYGGKSQIWEFRLKDTVPVLDTLFTSFLEIDGFSSQEKGVYVLDSSTLNIKYYSFTENATLPLKIKDGSGRLLKSYKRSVVYGVNYLQLKVPGNLEKGSIYQLEIEEEGGAIKRSPFRIAD
ncbi:hypothetical protein, partial [Polluticaenibacter yanchengensis]|nr:hypothetical protein [Chitinophagaceae bacterium LY-5]